MEKTHQKPTGVPMTEAERPPGKTTIAPGVLVTIVKAAALQVNGVSRLAQTPSGVNTLFQRGHEKGVQISVEEDGRVHADVFLILKGEVNLRDAGMNVQEEVSLAISKMVGLEVGSVNVHIEDVDFTSPLPDED
jgi:uncharacterized alkaline shock family protein YloU